MSHDPELEDLRERVHCAVVLERTPPPWKLDRRESTKLCLKYRRAQGEILIVNHEGRGWWDPMSDAKGDVFSLVQRLEPGLNFGHVRKRLREFAGVAPSYPWADRGSPKKFADVSVAERWRRSRPVRRGSPAWRYLTVERRLPVAIVEIAAHAGALKEGPHGSAWFAHRDEKGAVCHVDVRGPKYKGSLTGGDKRLYVLNGPAPQPRIVLAEGAIDAMSVAAIEAMRTDTLYAATGGGMGAGTVEALEQLLEWMLATFQSVILCSAADANAPGDKFAERHREIAERCGVAFERLRPRIEGGDWNDVLRQPQAEGAEQ